MLMVVNDGDGLMVVMDIFFDVGGRWMTVAVAVKTLMLVINVGGEDAF